MGDLVIGKASLCINAENLQGFAQTRYRRPVLISQRAMDHQRSMPARR
jgi:DNA-directed RNA polymerase subunit K/omega